MNNCCSQCDVDLDTVDEIEIYEKGNQEHTVCGECNQMFQADYIADGWSVDGESA